MEWIVFSLVAAFLFAIGNFLDKFIVDRQVSGSWDFIFSYGLVAWIFVALLVLFNGLPDFSPFLYLGILSGFLVAITGFFFARAMKVGETSRLVILFQIIPLVSVFFGWLLLGQALPPMAWLSFLIILIGGTITLLNRNEITIFSKGASDILFFSLLWGIVFVVTDYLLQFMSFWEYLLLQTLGLALSNFLFLLVPEARREIAGSYKVNPSKYISMTIVNSVDFLGKMSIVYAIGLAVYVGLVTVVLQAQSIFSVLIGVALTVLLPQLYKEDISYRNILQKLIGGILIFIGIALLFV